MPAAPAVPAPPPSPASPAAEGHRGQRDIVAVIALGGGLGSLARYGLARLWPTAADGFPWATFVTNALGSLALGALMVCVLDVWPASRYRRPFLGVGILGGFTTFSTYLVETRGLLAARQFALAGGYAFGSLLTGLLAVCLGAALARRLSRAARSGAATSGPAPIDPDLPGDGSPAASTERAPR
ncbi:fluoride efflux transporter FluC [Streptacidiphilus sp. PAMC 29251]